MSHGHSHAPGESHDHSHGPPQQQQQQQQQMGPPPAPDPALQALIEADYKPVDITLGEANKSIALCGAHSLELCAACDVNYTALNRLSRLLVANPSLLCPPPPNVISQKLSEIVNKTKDEGNQLYKAQKYAQALGKYTMAASFSIQRPPWEANQFMREELSTNLSNRSAAYFEAGDPMGALVDAESVIALRRPWSKGHFRKAKALVGLGQFDEAKDAVRLGLQFEPDNAELNGFLADIDKAQKAVAAKCA